MGFSLLHFTTCMDEEVVAHVQEVKGFSYKVVNPIAELVMIVRDEAALLAI